MFVVVSLLLFVCGAHKHDARPQCFGLHDRARVESMYICGICTVYTFTIAAVVCAIILVHESCVSVCVLMQVMRIWPTLRRDSTTV